MRTHLVLAPDLPNGKALILISTKPDAGTVNGHQDVKKAIDHVCVQNSPSFIDLWREHQTALANATPASLFTAFNSQRLSPSSDCRRHPYCKVDATLLAGVSSSTPSCADEAVVRICLRTSSKSNVKLECGFRSGQTAHVRVCHRRVCAPRGIHRVTSGISNVHKWERIMIWLLSPSHIRACSLPVVVHGSAASAVVVPSL